jgi:hypothetical protein
MDFKKGVCGHKIENRGIIISTGYIGVDSMSKHSGVDIG